MYQALPVASAIKKYFTAFPTKIAQPKAIQPVLTTPTKSIKQPIQTVASKPEPKLKPSSKPSPNLVNTLPVTHSKDTYVEHDTKTTMIVSPVHSSGKNNAATKSVVHSAVHPSPSPTTSKINTQYKVKASKSEY